MTWPADPPEETYVLRLFVTGTTTRSLRAIANVRRVCDEHLAGRFDLEVVDVYADPDATREHQIVATPTLVKVRPEPVRRLIGDLSDPARLLSLLDIATPGVSRERLS
jgi:circadian clock protein KaiB